ncbi:MAG: hypothetical protein IJK40_02385 [Clostridia bacterium]|nr:hypothetical protein [Clostridia bacterium]
MFDDKRIPPKTKETVTLRACRRRLPQSILLTGADERLREKCATELCMAALCEAPGNKPYCGKCPGCIRVKAGTHPDMVVLKPEKDKKSVSVKEVRERVTGDLYAAPTEGEVRIFVFHAAENLSDVIQNALLKTVEEPPGHTMFIFLCDQREHLLETVLSRVTEFYLGASPDGVKKDTAPAIAADIAKAMCGDSAYALMLACAPMQKNRRLMRRTAQELILLSRDALAADLSIEPLAGDREAAVRLHARFSAGQLLKLKAAMETVIGFADANANENLLLTRFTSLLEEIMST